MPDAYLVLSYLIATVWFRRTLYIFFQTHQYTNSFHFRHYSTIHWHLHKYSTVHFDCVISHIMYTKGLFGTRDIPFSMKNILDTFLCLFVIILNRLPSFQLIQNHWHQCKNVEVLLICNFHLKVRRLPYYLFENCLIRYHSNIT